MPSHVRSTAVALSVVALLLVSGCSAVTDLGGGTATGSPTGAEAADGYRSFDVVEATAHTVADGSNGSGALANATATRERIVRRPATGESWRKTLAPPDRAGDLVVSNRSVTWSYDASAGNATRIDATEFEAAENSYADYLRRLFDAVRGEADDAVGVSPLPVVPGTPVPPPPDNGSFRQFDVSYDGTATVDGRTAHVVEMVARDPGDEFAVLNQTLHLDAEYFYPLRQRSTYRFRGNATTYTVTHRNVTFDPDVEPGRFEFDPPSGTTIEETSLPESTTYDSLAALRANATLSVPDPSVPDGFSFARGRHTVATERNYTSVSLTYENASGSVSLSAHDTTDLFTGTGENETVRVGSTNATYREIGASRMVQWSCDGSQYSVSSNVLSRAALLEVARSVACDPGG